MFRTSSNRTFVAHLISNWSLRVLLTGVLILPAYALATPKSPATSTTEQQSDQRARLSAASQNSLVLNERGVEALRAKNFAQATELFEKALASDRYNLSAVYNLAGMYLLQKKNKQAQDLLQSYLNENPSDAGLATRLGDVHFASKNLPAAREAYQRALQADSKRIDALMRLASVYSLEAQPKKAEELLQQVLLQQPKNYEALSSLAGLYVAHNRPKEAVSLAKRALQVKPTREAYLSLGGAYELLHDPKNALIAYERARDLEHGKDQLGAELDQKISMLRTVLEKNHGK
jgi:tetratricopeptide (TPR) repeat protein